MTAEEIIAEVQSLNWKKGSYIVYGSCPMALVGLREAGDIDFLVSEELFGELRSLGWKQIEKSPDDKPLVYKDFEAHGHWNFSSYKPTLKQLLSTATVIEDIPFASLDEVLKWKKASGRPKDLVDIKLIDEYLSTNEGEAYTHYHKDGSVWAKGYVKDNTTHGYWEWFRKDGSKMRSGYFNKGKQTGTWTTYDKNGGVVKVTEMKVQK
jgi:hypothetical protein